MFFSFAKFFSSKVENSSFFQMENGRKQVWKWFWKISIELKESFGCRFSAEKSRLSDFFNLNEYFSFLSGKIACPLVFLPSIFQNIQAESRWWFNWHWKGRVGTKIAFFSSKILPGLKFFLPHRNVFDHKNIAHSLRSSYLLHWVFWAFFMGSSGDFLIILSIGRFIDYIYIFCPKAIFSAHGQYIMFEGIEMVREVNNRF